jgi:intein/homing endonuclease
MKFDFLKFKYNGKDIRKNINLSNKPTPELAEIIGVMLGDGNLYLDKKLKYHTIICFNKKEISYLNYVKKLFESYFYPYNFHTQELKYEIFLRNISKCIGRILVLTGVKEGNKVKNKVEVPEWIFSNEKFIISLLRGVFDTDGCVYRKYNNYAQIQFKFAGHTLLKSVREALIKLSYNPTKIQKGYNTSKGVIFWKFYLSRQNEIKRFFFEIKPANIKHIERFSKIINGDAGNSIRFLLI